MDIKKLLFMGGVSLALSASALAAPTSHMTLSFENIEPLKGQHYEGWNIVNGKAVTTGRFNVTADGQVYKVNADGMMVKQLGNLDEAEFEYRGEPENVSAFVLTIEPNGDMDPKPSSVHFVGGNFQDHEAVATTGFAGAIGTDFSSVGGSFILATPTQGPETHHKGIWFVNPETGMSSLSLPKLNDGWAYEGWIVNTSNGKLVSTGIFKDPNGIDSDGAGTYAGPLVLDFPAVAGQDYVDTHLVLNDGIHKAVISVEPYPDFNPAPFQLKVLAADIAKNEMVATPLRLNSIAHMKKPMIRANIH